MSSRAVKRTYNIYMTAVEAADLFANDLTVKIDFEFKVYIDNNDDGELNYRMFKWLIPMDGTVKKIEKTTELNSPSRRTVCDSSRLRGTLCLTAYVSDGTQHVYSFESSKFETSDELKKLYFDTKNNDPPIVLVLKLCETTNTYLLKAVSMEFGGTELKNFVASVRKDAANRALPSMVACAKRACKEEQYDASYYVGSTVLEPCGDAK